MPSFWFRMAFCEHFQAGIGKRGHELRQKWTKLFDEYGKKYPELAEELNQMQRRELPDGLGQGSALVSRRRQRHGDARQLGQSAQCDRAKRSLADGRVGGSGDFGPHAAEVRRCGGFPAGKLRRTQPAFRRSRTRHGCDPERHGGLKASPLSAGRFSISATT